MLALLTEPREKESGGTVKRKAGAGEGNRTPVVSLGSFCSTIELHPHLVSTIVLEISQIISGFEKFYSRAFSHMASTAYVQELSKLTSTSDLMSSIALVYFSPTGNTKKAVSSIGELPCVTVKTFDITGNVEVPETDLSGFDFVVFGAPVYAGRIPACSVDRFKKMKGSGTPCALVLTYGNRAYEDAPRELGDIAEANGFRIKGVATMASQHTYGQIQLGRPNKDDIAELQEFYFHMLAKAEEPETVIPPGNYPYKVVETKAKFKPTTNGNCLACGMCIRDCPVGAIEEDIKTVNDNCIGCMRCVKNCPMKAKSVVADAFSDFEKLLSERLKNRKENEFFV